MDLTNTSSEAARLHAGSCRLPGSIWHPYQALVAPPVYNATAKNLSRLFPLSALRIKLFGLGHLPF